MVESFILLRGIALGLLLGVILVIALRFRAHYALRALALFSASICGYLLAPILYGHGPAFFLAVAFSDMGVLTFLLLVQALFDEHPGPSRATLLYGCAYLLASALENLLEHGFDLDTRLLQIPVRIAMISGAVYALYVVGRNWRADLVQSRRQLRSATLVVAGVYILGITLVDSLSRNTEIPMWAELANSAGILLTLLVFLSVVLTLGTDGLLATTAAASPPTLVAADSQQPKPESKPEVDKIIHAMETDFAYRDMELTIRSFAANIGVPEHRLRLLINQHLNYRNFNDFLNHYAWRKFANDLRIPLKLLCPFSASPWTRDIVP